MGYLFTSESVSEGHPDKLADQISDAVLDNILAQDKNSKVACETLVTTGQVIIAGEIKTEAYVDFQTVVREVINEIGYTKSEYKFDGDACGILSAIHEQSGDINRGVERENPEEQGAGDQGMMFGYATNETRNLMPVAIDLSHALVEELAKIRKEGVLMTYLRPDSKSQVTIEYDDNNKPVKVNTIVVSTQHDDFVKAGGAVSENEADVAMLSKIREDVKNILIPRVKALDPQFDSLIQDDYILHVNPTGKFVIGGPHGDTGLTGRKIIVDTYGGKGAHGGGAFSGKDPSKVDRSAAYAARWVAKNIVAAGLASHCNIQLSYAIGVAKPISVHVDTYGTGKISEEKMLEIINKLFDLRPSAIIKALDLKRPIYRESARNGHFGRELPNFLWEKLNMVDAIKKEAGI